MTETGVRADPYRAYNFRMEIDGLTLAGFSEVSGLTTEGEVIEYRNGDHPFLTTTKFPGLRSYPNIMLRRGMTTSRELWRWRLNVINGKTDRRNGAVVLLDEERKRVVEWRFTSGWLVRYEGPSLNATGNEVAVEAIEIAHEGLLVA